MAKKQIPDEVREKVKQTIEKYNKKIYKKNPGQGYYAVFKGSFLYLNRDEHGKGEPVIRLRYTGDFDDWEFAIFRWSSETYDPDAWFFPGDHHFDGTIEGAMKAGDEAYPPNYSPSMDDMATIFKIFTNPGKKGK